MNRPLTVIVANGWSASSRKLGSRTKALVEHQLKVLGLQYDMLGMRSSFLLRRSRQFRRFIRDHQGSGRSLVCVGKSFGGKQIVEEVLNPINERLDYCGIYLITIDPNWPACWDLTPNLNRHTLRLTKPITAAVNVYFATKEPRKQAGAMLVTPKGTPVKNIPLADCDHYSIVQNPMTEIVIRKTLLEATK